MLKRFRSISLAILFGLFLSPSFVQAECRGNFPNLITDVCWKCFFPISIGGMTVAEMGQEDVSTGTGGNPICFCGILPGIRISFWEPVKMSEVVREPYCFPSLGGLQFMHDSTRGTKNGIGSPTMKGAFYQSHFIHFPLMAILGLLEEAAGCRDLGGLDYVYLTEFDPLWANDELSFIINPEAVLFANPIAQAVCAADCVAASAGFPLAPLFWCAGCWGSTYPFTGNTNANASPIQVSLLLTTRMLAKLHREMLLNMTITPAAECASFPTGMLIKNQYKIQMLYPMAETTKCNPIGRSQLIIGDHRTIPGTGEDYVYLIWRKRDCCLHFL